MIHTIQDKLKDLNNDVYECKTNGICYCPKEEIEYLINYKEESVKSGRCLRCNGLIKGFDTSLPDKTSPRGLISSPGAKIHNKNYKEVKKK